MFRPTHYANCSTSGVVYLLICQCGCFYVGYVGKTKQEFHKRSFRHILSMKTSNPDLPLGSHIKDVHAGKFPQIKFLTLDRIHPSDSGGDWNRILLQLETLWIINLEATSPPGLNDSYRPFLDGFSSGGWEE